MQHSKRSSEGYLLLNHKDSPGLTDEIIIPAGFPAGAGCGMFETAIITCHCCQTMIVLNPKRTRERAYCPTHDKYLCDLCEDKRIKTGVCKSFAEIADEMIENIIQGTLIKEI